MRNILEFTHDEARAYFLKQEHYSSLDLPPYFDFQTLLDGISSRLIGSRLSDFYGSFVNAAGNTKPTKPDKYDGVNYHFLTNKDGRYAWRPFQLIHPAIYVSLVHSITEEDKWNEIVSRFHIFQNNPKIRCESLPVESDGDENYASDKAASVMRWLSRVERESIKLSLDYQYIHHTDITDCYGAIYTHSIPWALHTKPTAKDNRSNSLIGNYIDEHLRYMSYGQTNGIPQGSSLMDFIAEMVLGYADLLLSERLVNYEEDYFILRYRDDYRIFSNNPQVGEFILKNLSEILSDLNLKLNPQKTMQSDDVISSSIKPDKQYWNLAKKGTKGLQNHLMIIRNLAKEHPNSGSLVTALNNFFKRLQGVESLNTDYIQILISILVDIAFKNPRIYPVFAAILSKLLALLEDGERFPMMDKILKRFEQIPNTGHLLIWLQRITLLLDRAKVYEEVLCKKVNDASIQIWNSDWLNNAFKTLIESTIIINEDVIDEMTAVMEWSEFSLFGSDYEYN